MTGIEPAKNSPISSAGSFHTFDVKLSEPQVVEGSVQNFVLEPHRKLHIGEWVQVFNQNQRTMKESNGMDL